MSPNTSALIVIAIAVCSVAGCEETLPSGPSELTTGVTIYMHADYGGDSAHITQDIKHLRDFKGPCEFGGGGPDDDRRETWDDCISSIRVAPGWRAVVFRDGEFTGDRLEVTSDIPNLERVSGRCDKGGFNDCVTSIRVTRFQ